ncbi:MAG: hypothetical protein Q7O66_19830, partial [Dehalococcoidia bacterium]|nr:hypothetical protein [Dehalococcoidia bacterium]
MATDTKALATRPQQGADLLEQVLLTGDLSKLTSAERLSYYMQVCQSVGLNHLTKPFDYLTLNGKLTLYARKDTTDQLRSLHAISVTKLDKEVAEGVYIVTAHVADKNGRTDLATGAVAIENLRGDARANAVMKAETKAKRRATLSICGLGWLDESEIESIAGAVRVTLPDSTPARQVDTAPGEVTEPDDSHPLASSSDTSDRPASGTPTATPNPTTSGGVTNDEAGQLAYYDELLAQAQRQNPKEYRLTNSQRGQPTIVAGAIKNLEG